MPREDIGGSVTVAGKVIEGMMILLKLLLDVMMILATITLTFSLNNVTIALVG